MALDGEDAGLVVELLSHILADALHGLAAVAGGVPRVRGTRRDAAGSVAAALATGLVTLASGPAVAPQSRRQRIGRCPASRPGLFLLGAEALALCNELQPLEDGVLMRELLDDGLFERSLGA